MVVPDGATPQLGEASTVSLDIDPAADDFVWQKGYAWCLTTPEAASGCAVYNSQAGDLPELAVLPGPHLPERQPSSPAASAAAAPSKASPGHLLLCGNAMIFGAAMATGNVLCGRGSEYPCTASQCPFPHAPFVPSCELRPELTVPFLRQVLVPGPTTFRSGPAQQLSP